MGWQPGNLGVLRACKSYSTVLEVRERATDSADVLNTWHVLSLLDFALLLQLEAAIMTLKLL